MRGNWNYCLSCGCFVWIKKIKVCPVSHFNLMRDKLSRKVFNLVNFWGILCENSFGKQIFVFALCGKGSFIGLGFEQFKLNISLLFRQSWIQCTNTSLGSILWEPATFSSFPTPPSELMSSKNLNLLPWQLIRMRRLHN